MRHLVQHWPVKALLMIALLMALPGCAPKVKPVRTPLDAEIAIRRSTDPECGRMAEIIDRMAEALASWRACRLAVHPYRPGMVRVRIVTEPGEKADALVKLAMPEAEMLNAATPELLEAAGLQPGGIETPDTVVIHAELEITAGSGCVLHARIQAAKAPAWEKTWNVVLTENTPPPRQRDGK